MESYIEVSFINNILIMFLSCIAAGFISLKPISIRRCLIYSTVLSVSMIVFWGRYAWILYIGLEVLFFTAYFRFRIAMYFVSIILRFLLSFTCFAFYGGSYHLFMYYVPIYRFPFVFWLILIFATALLLCKWKYFIGRLDFVYECSFKKLKLKGYLDSGNVLSDADIPVVFVSNKYQSYFKNENIHSIVMNTLDSRAIIICYEAEIQLQGFEKQMVYVNCDKKVQLPFGCDILLNAKMLMR